jgi:hypothetical protein
MNNINKKSGDVRDIFLLCVLCGILFCVFNQHLSEPKQKDKSEKQNEYVTAYYSPVISENHEIKISKPSYSSFLFQSHKENLQDKNFQEQLIAKDFSQIKILLKQSSYNQYFASGFHEPPLAA